MRVWNLAFFLPLTLPACASSSEGALGQTQATPNCSPSDLVCAVEGLDAPLARGASLPVDISVTSQGSAAPPLAFLSANNGIFTVEGTRIRGVAEGVASLLVTTKNDLAVDFFHVWVSAPDTLFLHRRTDEGFEVSELPKRLELLKGDELHLSVEAYRGAQRLLGDLDKASWTISSGSVELLDEGSPTRRRLVAIAPGPATIEASALRLKVALEVKVKL